MFELQTKRNIRCFTVERATVRLVFAALVEVQNGVEVLVSEPKLIKVLPKATATLPAGKKPVLALPGIETQVAHTTVAYVSPFVSLLFGNSELVINLAPQPPTRN